MLPFRTFLAILERHDSANTATGVSGLGLGGAGLLGGLATLQPYLAFGLTCLGLVATSLSIYAHLRKARARRKYRCVGCHRLNSIDD